MKYSLPAGPPQGLIAGFYISFILLKGGKWKIARRDVRYIR
jgi:hypothetical protein